MTRTLESMENVADALNSNESSSHKQEILREEIGKAERLRADARLLTGYSRKDLFKAIAKTGEDSYIAQYYKEARREARKGEDKDLDKLMREYDDKMEEVIDEMKASCK